MSDLAASGLAGALDRFARRERIVIALDFDGTLAPLVDNPDDSRPLPLGAAVLGQLAPCAGVTLALVSGRPLADLYRLATPPAGTYLIGSHGAEWGSATNSGPERLPSDLPAETAALLPTLRAELDVLADTLAGAWVEHKPVAEALHTRLVTDRRAAATLLDEAKAVGRRHGIEPLAGHDVVELAVAQTSKGDALTSLRDQVRPDAVLYAGDDVTDEKALATLRSSDVGIKVGKGESLAEFRVADPQALCEALAHLADVRLAIG